MPQLLAAPYSYFSDANGAPLSGGKVFTYAAGTATPKDSYTDSTGTIVASNPVILDSAGRATIWLSGFYKIIVKDSLNNVIDTTDNITATGATGDMNTSTYDPAGIQEQLVGLTATQTLSNKTLLDSPIAGIAAADVADMNAVENSMMGGFLNRFRNGSLSVWQRGNSGAITTTNASYTADGIIVTPTGATVNWSRLGGGLGFGGQYSLTLTGNTSMTQTTLKIRLKVEECAYLFNAKAITVQFAMQNATGASITPTITVNYPTAADNFSAVTNLLAATNLQTLADGAKITQAYTFQNTSQITGLEIIIALGSALNANTKSVFFGDFDIRVTSGVQTGNNIVPPVFEKRLPATDWNLCQRFLETSFIPGTIPADGAGNATGTEFMAGKATTGTQFTYIQYKVPKESLPSITLYNPSSGTAAQAYDVTAAGSMSATATGAVSVNGFRISATGNASTAVGNICGIGWLASCEA